MTATQASARTEAVRRFNRFYTRRIGVLHENLAATRFSLTESRLLWELAHRERTTGAELARDLDLDPGYLSRLLRAFKEQQLIRGERAADDARHLHLRITPAGRRAFAPLDRQSAADVERLLAGLGESEQLRLLAAMTEIEALLGERRGAAPWLLRAPRPGDLGWVVERHGRVYGDEYGWDLRFESLVARIAADFVDRLDPAREACWIAERDGSSVGCVFLVQARDETPAAAPIEGTAQLRMLLVEPGARGLGIGARLVGECERFARARGYRRIVLWTNSVLTAARAIYRRAGYVLTASEPHESFGHALVGETWALELDDGPSAVAATPG